MEADEREPIRRAPGVMMARLSTNLNTLLARGIASYAEDDVIDLMLEPDEAAEGGMITIPMHVVVRCTSCGAKGCGRCSGRGSVEDLFAAWLAVRPGVSDGTILTPSAWLPGMLHKVYFRVRLAPPGEGVTV